MAHTLLVVAAVLVIGLPIGAQAKAMTLDAAKPATSGAAALRLVSTRRLDDRLLELTMRTAALTTDTHVRVLLPSGYTDDVVRRYPVLYLLHGGGDNYTSWARAGGGDAERLTANLRLIVVMPDAGMGGWYTNWVAPGLRGQPRWETYHIDQLIPWVDQRYRTVASGDGRAIAGLSMGGFGALSYAARHPDLFAAAASFSGAVDTNTPPLLASHVIDTIGLLDGALPGSLFGLRETDEVRWRSANPWDLARNLQGLDITIRCGDGNTGGRYGGGGLGDSASYLEDVVRPMNVSLHARLVQLGIKHVYDAYVGGTHSWPYWNADLVETLPSLMASFAHPRVRSSFSYTAVDPTYAVFGWTVELTRNALEWSTIRNADSSGFTLTGSGRATVTTAASYTANGLYRIVERGGANTTTTVRAGPDGRLRIQVALGPPNLLQEQFVVASPGVPVATTSSSTAVAISPVAS